MANPEDIQIGDIVHIEDEFGNTVEGTVVNDAAWGNEGQYAVAMDDWGCYTRTADEMTVVEP